MEKYTKKEILNHIDTANNDCSYMHSINACLLAIAKIQFNNRYDK